tara:strand:- start:288 stop:815 length:528 start_codon:yes stop_codon:yes gene_type:complete
MARKPLGKSNPVGDVEAKINADFNQLIKKIHKQLSTKKRSPVYTGFFASSWKVQTMGVKAVDKVEDFQPWSSIKKAKKDSWNKDSVKTKNTTYKIQPRFPVTKTFNFKKPVFIGNRAKYAAYALEGGKVQFFVQGELGRLIRETMKDKKGKLFLASRQTRGLSSEGTGGQAYTEF